MTYCSFEDLIPIFVRAGSIIPLQNTINISNTNELANNYVLHVFLLKAKSNKSIYEAYGKLIDIDDLYEEKMVEKFCVINESGCLLDVNLSVLEQNDAKFLNLNFTRILGDQDHSQKNSISKIIINGIDQSDIMPIMDTFQGDILVSKNEISQENVTANFTFLQTSQQNIQLVLEFKAVHVENGISISSRIDKYNIYLETKGININRMSTLYLVILIAFFVLNSIRNVFKLKYG